MSSLKMTFSLTSLIFLIALGLVFVPMSVMADNTSPVPPSTTHNTAGHESGEADGDEARYPGHVHPAVTFATIGTDGNPNTPAFEYIVADGQETATSADIEISFKVTVTFPNGTVRQDSAALNPAASGNMAGIFGDLVVSDKFNMDLNGHSLVSGVTLTIDPTFVVDDDDPNFNRRYTTTFSITIATVDAQGAAANTKAERDAAFAQIFKNNHIKVIVPVNVDTFRLNVVADADMHNIRNLAQRSQAFTLIGEAVTPDPLAFDLTGYASRTRTDGPNNSSWTEIGLTGNANGNVGKAYSFTLPEAMNGTPPYTYSLHGGAVGEYARMTDENQYSTLYSGPKLTKLTRLLSGTPTRLDWSWYTWSVTDDAGMTQRVSFVSEIAPPSPVPIKVMGTPDLIDPFVVTFEAPENMPTRLEDDPYFFLDITGGSFTEFRREDNPTAPRVVNTLWYGRFQPALGTKSLSISVKSNKWTTPATVNGELRAEEPKGTLSSITVPTGTNASAPFVVSFTFADALPENVSLKKDDIEVTPAAKEIGTPVGSLTDTKVWQVLITPASDVDTMIDLSPDGKLRFDYAGDPIKVEKKTVVTLGAVTATFVAGKEPGTGITTLAGEIGANDFASISRHGSVNFPDLEYFFEQRGTIDLHDNDDATKESEKGTRQVVISEILWGLDLSSAVIGDRTQFQFIELYNTTDKPVDVTGWTLVFSLDRPTDDKIDVDQVSSQPPFSLGINFLEVGESGRVTETTAKDTKATLSPAKIVSMFRKIDYDKVEKMKDGKPDPSREEQLKGIPTGNAIGSWAESQRPDPETRDTAGALDPVAARWIYATRNARHHPTPPDLLVATKYESSPFRINEIGNDSGADNDWVELHNVTDGVVSLKNYALSAVTAKGTDTPIFDFKDQDWKVPAKDFIVIATRHPQYTDLATGKDVSLAADLQDPKGLKHLYVVKPVNLPDDGKFTLILRSAHDKKGKAEAIVDVAASRDGAFSDVATASKIWPLVGSGLPHENTIDGKVNNFAAGKVYQRNGGDGRSDKNFAVAGYTGIGYDVKAEVASTNHGTPGYDNGALKANMADLKDGVIKISEIMVDVGDSPRRNLPQWIELHNSSKTLGVNLDGWKINIENAAELGMDPETNTFYASITLGAKTILPNQTVLVVSRTGDVRNPNHFPRTRVVNLWTNKAHREELEMTRSTDQVLSTRGFSIELVDKDNNPVDRVGNLDGKRHTRDNLDNTWAIPMSDDPQSRSSMLRIYDQKVALDGTMEKSWKLASETILAFEDAHAYYGNADDVGTPGYRDGGPLPVSLSKFRPERMKDTGEVVVRWITESELNNAGFNILRSEKRDGEFTKVHYQAGQGTTTERTVYEWKDKTAKPNVVYYYQIQDVSLDGDVTTLRVTHLRGNVTAAGKLTTTWAGLKALQ